MSGTTPPYPPEGFGPVPAPDGAPAGDTPEGPQADTVSFDGFGPNGPLPPAALEEPPQSPQRHTGKVVAIVAALTLVVGGGAFAFVKADPLNLFKAGPQAAEAMPDTALAYFGVDLDPSAVQKVNALRFLNHFPGFTDVSGIKDERSDVREAIFDEALDSTDCSDISYNKDIEPWLGYKFGVAMMPPEVSGDEPGVVFALEVTETDQATDELAAISDCLGGADASAGFASSGDYVLVTESQPLADSYADQTANGSLAESDAFNDDMNSLGELGVATGWADIAGIIDAFPDEESSIGGAPITAIPDLDALTSSYQRVAATFRFSSDHVELVASSYGDQTEIDQGENEIVNLPDSTVFAMSQASGDQRLAASWDNIEKAIESGGVDLQQQLADFEDETGLSIPTDIETLLGDNLLLAIDADGLTAGVFEDVARSRDLSKLNVGLRFKGDHDKLDELYQRIADLVGGSFATELLFSKIDFENGLVMATNDDYGNTLVDLDGDLGESDQFQSVVDDAANKELVIYFDWDQVEDEILDAVRADGGSADDIANLTPLRAFGLSTETSGDYTFTTFQMSVND